MTRVELAGVLHGLGLPEREIKMRVAQLWHWIYVQGATRFDAMLNIGKPLRALLAERYTLDRPAVVAEQVSVDGTRKWLIRMPSTGPHDRGAEIECVYIPESDRGTLCVSSQVGCTLTCTFCHTGTQKLVRNLSSREIVQQLLVARDRLGDFPGLTSPTDGLIPSGEGVRAVSNIVFMGMGEPLYNLDGVRDAIGVLSDGDGLSLSRRRITVSTSGVVPQIEALGRDVGTMLAISLHAVRDELRDELVPLNRKYPIRDLLDACRSYPGVSNARRITFEYVMLKGGERLAQGRAGAGAAVEGHPGQDQPHPLQPLAGHPVRLLRLVDDRDLFRHRLQGRLCQPCADAAGARHPGGLRAAEERDREAARPRPADAGPRWRSASRIRGGVTGRNAAERGKIRPWDGFPAPAATKRLGAARVMI